MHKYKQKVPQKQPSPGETISAQWFSKYAKTTHTNTPGKCMYVPKRSNWKSASLNLAKYL